MAKRWKGVALLALLSSSLLVVHPAACSEMVDVGGHRLFLDCEGTVHGATVVLIAGGGGSTATWDRVQQPIARWTRVCSYDRLGLGRSDALGNGESQSVDSIVADLAALLKTAHIQPPYVLVGHSIGGLYARAFDRRFDAQVAGMVLVDSAHEEQIWRFAEDEPEALAEYPDWRDAAAMQSQGFLPPGQLLTWTFTKPLVVLEHGHPVEPVWHRMQLDLSSRSPQGRLITATESTHYIQKIQPNLVIGAVHDVLRDSTTFRAEGVSR